MSQSIKLHCRIIKYEQQSHIAVGQILGVYNMANVQQWPKVLMGRIAHITTGDGRAYTEKAGGILGILCLTSFHPQLFLYGGDGGKTSDLASVVSLLSSL